MDITGVYKITSPSGRIYIGSSKHISKRFKQYKRLTETSQPKLHNSFLKHGVDSHKFEIVCECSNRDLFYLERVYGDAMDVLDRKKGLNCSLPGYDDVKKVMSCETRKKIGAAHKGKTISKKHREQISKKLKGISQTKEHIMKRKMWGKHNPAFKNNYFKGKKHTAKTKELFSAQRKGKKLLGDNSNAKQVLDIKTGLVYSSAKEVSLKQNINYSTLKAWLQGRNKNERYKYV